MNNYLTTTIGRFRLLGFLEGVSLLLLVFVAMPMKYSFGDPSLVKLIGPIHGGLFVFFVVETIRLAITRKWGLGIAMKLLLACILPFGTFYADHKILSKM
ncbi:MAG: DUF3817 domain-containing protein [Chitinophagales bacterium]